MKKILVIILVLLAGLAAVAGERYVIDNLVSDSAAVYPLKFVKGDTTVVTGKAMQAANGDTVTFVKVLNGYALIKYQGKLKAVTQNNLQFCPDSSNPDSRSFQSEDIQRYHSAAGHFFYTLTPYCIMLVLIVLTVLIIPAARHIVRSWWLAISLLYLATVLLLAISLLEIAAHYYTGNLLWWIDPDETGFWKACLMCLPLVGALALQLYIGLDYKRLIQRSAFDKLSWRPIFIGFALAIPIGIVTGILMAVLDLRPYTNAVVAVTVLGTIGFCLMKILRQNCKAAGIALGTVFSIFSTVFALSVILVGCMLVQILLQLLLTALPWLLLLLPLGSRKVTMEERQHFYLSLDEYEKSVYMRITNPDDFPWPRGSKERIEYNRKFGRASWM